MPFWKRVTGDRRHSSQKERNSYATRQREQEQQEVEQTVNQLEAQAKEQARTQREIAETLRILEWKLAIRRRR